MFDQGAQRGKNKMTEIIIGFGRVKRRRQRPFNHGAERGHILRQLVSEGHGDGRDAFL